MPKENAEQVAARLLDIEQKAREIKEARGCLKTMEFEYGLMTSQLRLHCPHTRIVEAGDEMHESCGQCYDRLDNHKLRCCEDCGEIEAACPMYFDGWYHLNGEAKVVGGEEFNQVYYQKHLLRPAKSTETVLDKGTV